MRSSIYAAAATILALTVPAAAQQTHESQHTERAADKAAPGHRSDGAGNAPMQDAGKPSARDEVRHSGKVVEIARDDSRFVLEEMVTWQSPDRPGIIHRSIDVTPRTAIQLIERQDEWGETRTSMPGWQSTSIDPRDLRTGDFVTVTTDDDARSRAISLQVIRPGS